MGSIIKKGITYAGAMAKAIQVKFENLGTGISSQTVQGAITEVNSKADEISTDVQALSDNLTSIDNKIKSISVPSTSFVSSYLEITDYLPNGYRAIAFYITSGVASAVPHLWFNTVNNKSYISFRGWADNAMVASGTVSGVIVAIKTI